MSYFKWTHERIALSGELALTHSMKEAADVLGCSVKSLSNHKKRFGIAFQKRGSAHHSSKTSENTVLMIFQLHMDGVDGEEIGNVVGLTKSEVSLIINNKTGHTKNRPIFAIAKKRQEKAFNEQLMIAVLDNSPSVDEAARTMAQGGSGFTYWRRKYIKLLSGE